MSFYVYACIASAVYLIATALVALQSVRHSRFGDKSSARLRSLCMALVLAYCMGRRSTRCVSTPAECSQANTVSTCASCVYSKGNHDAASCHASVHRVAQCHQVRATSDSCSAFDFTLLLLTMCP